MTLCTVRHLFCLQFHATNLVYVQSGSGSMKYTAKQTVAGVKEITQWVLDHSSPETVVVIQGLLPRGLHLPEHINYCQPSMCGSSPSFSPAMVVLQSATCTTCDLQEP